VNIIRFFSDKKYMGLGQPQPAKKFLPKWYKDSETVTIDENGEEHSGLKRCIPFLDSMISGYMLITPVDIFISKNEDGSLNIRWNSVEDLEDFIDHYNAKLDKLDSFILPGGTSLAAGLHVARTVVRRAERATWHAIEAHGLEASKPGAEAGGINILAAKYLNRLSDLLFVLARFANLNNGGDVKWTPSRG
jgi:ATP:cob(I)alamin adenosyltransferase